MPWQDPDPEIEALCCCEYISDVTGDRSHLLAICCDCDAIDDTFESVITGQNLRRTREIWPVIKDRMRIPWFDGSGAKRLIFLDEPITTIPFIIVPCFAFLAIIGPISTCLSFVTLFILLFGFRKKLRGSKFYVAFLIAAAAYAFLVFQLEVVPTLSLSAYLGNMFLLALVLLTIIVVRTIHFRSKISTNLSARVNLLPSYCYCRTCQSYIEGRDHHCIWLGCCIGSKNRNWFIGTLSLFSFWLIWTIVLFIQSLYYDSSTSEILNTPSVTVLQQTEHENHEQINHNQDHEFVHSTPIVEGSIFYYLYHDFHSAIRSITMVFGCIILLLVLAVLVHQYRMMVKGMSYLEWKYLQKMNRASSSGKGSSGSTGSHTNVTTSSTTSLTSDLSSASDDH